MNLRYNFPIILYLFFIFPNEVISQINKNFQNKDIIDSIITITGKQSFSGDCFVGDITGSCRIELNHFSKKYPLIYVDYTALGRNAREGEYLSNFSSSIVENSNNLENGTKIINADWKKEYGKVTIALLNQKKHPFEFIFQINGSGWLYVINYKLNSTQFGRLSNILFTDNYLKKRDIEFKMEADAKERKRVNDSVLIVKKAYDDSVLLAKRAYDDSILRAKRAYDDSVFILNQRIKRSEDSTKIERLLDTLKVGSLYDGGVVISFDRDKKQGVICSLLDYVQGVTGLEAQSALSKNSGIWRVPTKAEMDSIIEGNIFNFSEGVYYISSTFIKNKSESVNIGTRERIWGGYGGRFLNNMAGNQSLERIISGDGIWVQTMKARRNKNKGFWLILESERKGYNKNIKFNVRLVRDFSNQYKNL
jgi:hypothetical protein